MTPWGNPKTGNYRSQFLLESVLDLKKSLRAVDSDLVIKFGKPEEVLPGTQEHSLFSYLSFHITHWLDGVRRI